MLVALLSVVAWAATASDPVKPNVTPETALDALVQGNKRFVAGETERPNADRLHREHVSHGQRPFATVLACADSRVPPELLFDRGLGDLFVVRLAGNTYGPDGLGSIEYSVAMLGVRLIVVMGHESCGAVAAAVEGKELPGWLPAVVEPLKLSVKATEHVHDGRVEATVLENVRRTRANMSRDSEILGALVKSGELAIVGAYYDLDSGVVKFLDDAEEVARAASRPKETHAVSPH